MSNMKLRTPRYPKLKLCAHCGDKPYWSGQEGGHRDGVRQFYGTVRCPCGMSTPYGNERLVAYHIWNQRVKTMKSKIHPLRDTLIERIADFLTTDVARKSIELQMGKPDAKAWAAISNALTGSGYDTKEQRIESLKTVLGVS